MEIFGKVQKINVLRNYLCILLSSVGPRKLIEIVDTVQRIQQNFEEKVAEA